jgi:hypothetical protein
MIMLLLWAGIIEDHVITPEVIWDTLDTLSGADYATFLDEMLQLLSKVSTCAQEQMVSE